MHVDRVHTCPPTSAQQKTQSEGLAGWLAREGGRGERGEEEWERGWGKGRGRERGKEGREGRGDEG